MERYLQPMEVISFFVLSGGRVTNIELINQFRDLLAKTPIGQSNHAYLKRITAKLAIVKKIQGSKYLQLKPELEGLEPYEVFSVLLEKFGHAEVSNVDFRVEERDLEEHRFETITRNNDESGPVSMTSEPDNSTFETLSMRQDEFSMIGSATIERGNNSKSDTLTRARSRMPIYDPISLEKEMDYFMMPKNVQEYSPPGTFQSSKFDSQQEKEIPQPMEEEKPQEESEEEQDEVFPLPTIKNNDKERTLTRVRISVKDLSKSFEAKIEEQIPVAPSGEPKKYEKEKRKIIRKTSSDIESENLYPYTPLDPNKRKWILAASKNDERTLKHLMTADPLIVRTRDPTTGYTALHWAARRGNDGLLHLLIGRYRMEVNLRSRGGYTPLMLAAAHKKIHIYNLLLNPYGANPHLRDYSGKRADQYLDIEEQVDEEKDAADGATVTTLERKKIARRRVDKSSSFIKDLVRDSMRSSNRRPKSFNNKSST